MAEIQEELTLGEVSAANQALQKLLKREYSPSVCYVLGKNSRTLVPKVAEIGKFRDSLILELGEQNEDGSFHVPPSKTKAFMGRFGEYLSTRAVITFQTIKLSSLKKDITGDEMTPVLFLFENDIDA